MTTRPRILLDCDPGIDDAFAILCALRFADLAAITTVSGNVPIAHTTRNALHVLDLAQSVVPVHRGAEAPLVVPAMFADAEHGPAGLGSNETPVPSREPSGVTAVDAIFDFCADGGATIVATGPLTNIASALRLDPTLATRVSHLHWMGGSTGAGNTTPHGEFNAWADPHAVDLIFRSDLSFTMYGLNLTHQVRLEHKHIEILRQADTETSRSLAEFLAFYEAHAVGDGLGQPMHDPCALLGVTHPELFTVEASPMIAHVDGERRGMTEELGTDADVARHFIARTADAPSLIDLILSAATNPRGTS